MTSDNQVDRPSSPAIIALAWLVVLVPLGYGLISTIIRAAALFTH
ncbi:MFS transporter small subunit [Epidermidibacterium keratini]|nr:oxalate:formate antiporter [Epidermidibacterium keratini]